MCTFPNADRWTLRGVQQIREERCCRSIAPRDTLSQINEQSPRKNPRIPHFHLLRLNRSARATCSPVVNIIHAQNQKFENKPVSTVALLLSVYGVFDR